MRRAHDSPSRQIDPLHEQQRSSRKRAPTCGRNTERRRLTYILREFMQQSGQLTSQQRAELERRVHAGTTSQRDCLRARIILLRADGMRQEDVGREVGLSTTSVNKWSQRFARHGLEGLKDQSGRGRKSAILLEKVEQVITQAGQAPPGRQRWSSPASSIKNYRKWQFVLQ